MCHTLTCVLKMQFQLNLAKKMVDWSDPILTRSSKLGRADKVTELREVKYHATPCNLISSSKWSRVVVITRVLYRRKRKPITYIRSRRNNSHTHCYDVFLKQELELPLKLRALIRAMEEFRANKPGIGPKPWWLSKPPSDNFEHASS